MMPPPRPHGLGEVVATFGDPLDYLNDKATWERYSLATVPLHTPLLYAYDTSRMVTRIRAHRLIADHLVATLMECFVAGVEPERLKYGGAYVWRAKRTGSALSLHTWGIAVDLEPAENPLCVPWVDDGKMLDPRIIETFGLFGWHWGGLFEGVKDPMHFQFASGA